jgi:hypothetical protein
MAKLVDLYCPNISFSLYTIYYLSKKTTVAFLSGIFLYVLQAVNNMKYNAG